MNITSTAHRVSHSVSLTEDEVKQIVFEHLKASNTVPENAKCSFKPTPMYNYKGRAAVTFYWDDGVMEP